MPNRANAVGIGLGYGSDTWYRRPFVMSAKAGTQSDEHRARGPGPRLRGTVCTLLLDRVRSPSPRQFETTGKPPFFHAWSVPMVSQTRVAWHPEPQPSSLGIQKHGPAKSMAWPVFMAARPRPDGPSRNDTRVFQHPASPASTRCTTHAAYAAFFLALSGFRIDRRRAPRLFRRWRGPAPSGGGNR